MNKVKIIPLNEIPEEWLNNQNLNIEIEDIKEKVTLKENKNDNNIQPLNNNVGKFRYNLEKEIAFVWGFLFFDIPNITVIGNKIYFTGEIHRESVHSLKEKIIEISDKLSKIYNETGEKLPIYLFINSPGGAVHSGFDLIDFIESYHFPIITIGTGRVASMAFLVLLAGKEKYLTPNSHILIHQISTMIGGKRQDILDYVKHIEDLHNQIIKFITSRTNLKTKEVEELLSRESWLNAEEATSKGLIDDIWNKK